ncbi:mechanosensitive ion channel family protein [Rubrivirga sp.]|uniref:mechanosensitive ion channel family protein n=1 Tax=Rubrivirga sp. TaxID=1885344 RepID=UPI003C756327
MQILPAAPDTLEADAPAAPDDTTAGITVSDLEAARDVVVSSDFWLGLGQTLIQFGVVVGLALLAIWLVKRIKKRWVASVEDDPATDKRRQRVLTTADILGSLARYVIWTIAAFTVLEVVGIPVGPLLAGAGIAGLAIGFGAQTLVRDVISGFFLLFDDTLGSGDLIRIGDEVGTVEYVGLRLIKVRKFDGELLMIPAGELRTFGNKSIGYARVVVNVGLSYEQDATQALRVLEDVAAEWAESEGAQAIMVEDAPQVQGLLELGDSAVTARVIVQVKPGEQFAADREIRSLIKTRFDERGIEIPFPRRTVYVKSLDDGAPDLEAAAGAS